MDILITINERSRYYLLMDDVMKLCIHM